MNDHISQSAIVPAIASTKFWSMNNNMLLNTDKTEIMNTSLSHRHSSDDKVMSNGILLPLVCIPNSWEFLKTINYLLTSLSLVAQQSNRHGNIIRIL